MITAIYGSLFYLAALILFGGVAYKIRQYTLTPAPLKIAVTPAPTTSTGVVFRMFREVVFFETLFKSNKWIWLFGYIFHASLLLVVLRHLRYFTEPVWFWVSLIQPFGLYAGFAAVVGLGGLWFRRIAVERVRYISSPSDHLMLALLAAIFLSGLFMRYVERTDIVALKAFVLGLLYFDWQPMPADPILMIHLGLVIVLMIVFPISKLLHAPGLFFSPTLNQVDNPREQRHLAPWAAKLDPRSGAGTN
ncbi:MAG: respiratory nitrate reductase subunit gamma [Rhodospirillales bacterium]|nr:respiratory nitrate reductase subunit gamma [Alphaproteobacteria bacterium]MBL6948228.1 respiratory nitrate reductase subunit gamma [Rhodospirillales bacterium]